MKHDTVRGDEKPMTDKGASTQGDYAKSLGDANKSDLMKGYCDKGQITGDTRSDKGYA